MNFCKISNPYLEHLFRCLIFSACLLSATALANTPNAIGVVYEDANQNQKFDP